MTGDVPEEVRALAAERDAARRGKDFQTADALRERIGQAGFEVTDTAEGTKLTPRRPGSSGGRSAGPAQLGASTSSLAEPPRHAASVQWVVQGWPEDAIRGMESVRQTTSGDVQQVVVDAAGLLDQEWPAGAEVIRVPPESGWAAARNAGLQRAAGEIVVLVDGSVEATGDLLEPLAEALRDPTVGVTGPFGIVTQDLREFVSSEGPEVDAVEGYLMAFRRELVEQGLRFDEKFKFYRSADIELSFQIKAMGLRATVAPVPVVRHEHRMWANTPQERRDQLSKRNHYRFLDRWRGRSDLLVKPKQTRGP